MSARLHAPPVEAVTNVTALVGRDLEPQICDIHVGDGLIVAITPPGGAVERSHGPADEIDADSGPPGAETASISAEPPRQIDGSGLIAVPGMADVHDHLRMLAPGLSVAEGLVLDEFLRVQWATQAHMGPAEYEVCALLGSLQRLKCGITTVVDHAYTFHAPGLDEACIAGYEASGVRWAYARGIMTRPYAPVCESFEQAADAIRAVLDHTPVTPERLFVAPVSIRQATLRRVRPLSGPRGRARRRHLHPRLGDRRRARGLAGRGRRGPRRGPRPGRLPHRAHRAGPLRDPRRRRGRAAGG